MEDLISKPPKSAREYYLKLYCSKNTSKSSKSSRGIRKAKESWWSLSAAEQQPFVDKFNLIQEKYRNSCISYLKSLQPFMKRKVVRKANSGQRISESSETEISQEDNHLNQTVTNNTQDNNDSIVNGSLDQNDQNFTSLDINCDVNDSAYAENNNDAKKETEATSKLTEPTPPSTKNGKELFDMISSVNGRSNSQWKNLSHLEKCKYRSAVLAIKRDYIKEYHNYLESLPDEELFKHYIKTLEK